MKIKNVVTAAMLSGMLFAVPALAQNPNGGFSALQGVEFKALSADEMQAVSGKFNAYDMAANREALAAQLDQYPRLRRLF